MPISIRFGSNAPQLAIDSVETRRVEMDLPFYREDQTAQVSCFAARDTVSSTQCFEYAARAYDEAAVRHAEEKPRQKNCEFLVFIRIYKIF